MRTDTPTPNRPFRTVEMIVRESGREVKRIEMLDSPAFDVLSAVPRRMPDHADVVKIVEALRRTA